MWSSDFPHNESTFGYSRRSLSAVVDSVGRSGRRRSSAPTCKPSWASSEVSMTVTDIPDVPDIARMRRETGQKLRTR